MTDINRIPFKPRHVLDKDLQMQTHRAGYDIQWHPRRFSKPLSCQGGKHGPFVTQLINRIPHLVCKKCGAGIAEGLHDKTWSKNDIHKIKLIVGSNKQPRTKEERMKASWEAMEQLRSKYSEADIQKMLKQRKAKQLGLL